MLHKMCCKLNNKFIAIKVSVYFPYKFICIFFYSFYSNKKTVQGKMVSLLLYAFHFRRFQVKIHCFVWAWFVSLYLIVLCSTFFFFHMNYIMLIYVFKIICLYYKCSYTQPMFFFNMFIVCIIVSFVQWHSLQICVYIIN